MFLESKLAVRMQIRQLPVVWTGCTGTFQNSADIPDLYNVNITTRERWQALLCLLVMKYNGQAESV